ncbi:MAG TPA: SpoIID/LytB domain-containing protein, partial [Allocoleopsis sp.]
QDKATITNLALSITDLENKKIALEEEEKWLTATKASLDEKSAKLDKLVSGAKAYQAQLSSQIAQLSAKQQSLIAAKQASLGLPTSAYTTQGGCSSDLTNGKDPGFSPRFGLFSFGVPHRVGLNQYGAKGRADAGQSTEQILSAYYNADLNKGYDTGITIHVTGTNEYGQSFDTNWNIEEYVKHIYEIPATWNPAALRAQAVAARSYALAYTNNGSGSICSSQSCQVVKQELNSVAWQQAVDDTKGWVLTSGGQPIKAWFSSTAGGYFHSSSDVGWSGTAWTKTGVDASGSVNSFSDLLSKAYDRESPWFYCDWGSHYNGTAWLKSEELADIVNVILLAKADGSTQ